MSNTLWKKSATREMLNQRNNNTLASLLDIDVTEVGEDYIICSMPVNSKTHQPMGLLHGGASVVLAETVGSIASNMSVDGDHYCVGMEINANHVRGVRSGKVFAKATALHLGKTSQVWDIKVNDENQKTTCISRLTMAVLRNKN